MPESACFCADVPAIATRVRVVIVRHTAEIAKTSNTGRMAARALTNSVMVDHGVPGQPLDLSALVEPDARVLYPGPEPEDRPQAPTLAVLGEPEAAEALRGVFAAMAARMRDLRGFDPPPRRAP